MIKVEMVKTYICPLCGEGHPDEDDAYDCCCWQCEICAKWYEDEEEAEECCH